MTLRQSGWIARPLPRRLGAALAMLILLLVADRAEAQGPGRILSVNGNAFGASLIAVNPDGTNRIHLKTDTSVHQAAYPPGEDRHRDVHPSQAANGVIAFESNRDQPPGGVSQTGWRIYTMNADGSNVQQRTFDTSTGLLAPNQVADNYPVISPNGARIAFVSNRSDTFLPSTTSVRGMTDLFLVNADGTGLRQVTVTQPNLPGCSGVNGSVIESAAWSPDGTTLAYRGRRVVGTQNGCPVYRRVIGLINPDGTGDSHLLQIDGQACAAIGAIEWSPLGTMLAFTDQCNGAQRVKLLGVGGTVFGATLPLDEVSVFPGTVRFSPDGQHLAIARADTTVSIVTLAGAAVRTLSLSPRFRDDALWWSPGPAIPTPARFVLSPDDLLIRDGERLRISATLLDADGNVIVRAAKHWILNGTNASSPRLSPSGDVIGSAANQTYVVCAENGGLSDCMNVRNFNRLTLTAVTPSAGLTTGGSKLRIEAFRIGAAPTVTIGGAPSPSVEVVGTSTIVAVAPPRTAGTVTVAVSSGSETSSLPGAFTYVLPATNDTIDTDADGMPDAWEAHFHLDPRVADATADADGDGRTNLQEFQAGTHPLGVFSGYLAEGASTSFFRTTLALVNPTTVPATALLRYLKGDGTIATANLPIAPLSRATVDPADTLGTADAEFSSVVEADVRLVVDRSMRWDTATGYGSHAETSIPSAGLTWYLAEGATHSDFDLFYLIQNPSSDAASVRVTYLLPEPAVPIVKTYSVGANSRFNIWVDQEGAALTATDVSAIIESANGVPILVERAMYLTRRGQTFAAGHNSAAVQAPATSWFLAEGATGSYFDLFVLIANPGATPASIEARYLLPDGRVVVKTHTVAARSRFNIWVDLEDALLADTAVSTTITSLNAVPIIVERTMWWPGPTSDSWQEGHNSSGATETGTRWVMAEGEQGGPGNTETYVLIANTSGTPGSASVTLLFEDGTTAQQTFALAPSSRFNVAVGAMFSEAAGRRFGTIVESLAVGGDAAAELVVERAMYSDAQGVVWAAGTNARATKLR